MADPAGDDECARGQCAEWVGGAGHGVELGDGVGLSGCEEGDGCKGEEVGEGAWGERDEEGVRSRCAVVPAISWAHVTKGKMLSCPKLVGFESKTPKTPGRKSVSLV